LHQLKLLKSTGQIIRGYFRLTKIIGFRKTPLEIICLFAVMLKRFSHISLSLLLLISTVGFAVSKHYCGDALVDIAFNENAENCCDTGSCCHNETQLYQLDEDFSAPAISTVPVMSELKILGHDLFASIGLVLPETETDAPGFAESPPILPIQKTLALKEVFLL